MGSTLSENNKVQEDYHLDTLTKMVDDRAARYGNKAVLERKRDGGWESMSWKDLSNHYREVARGLMKLGIGKGDRVAILSENRPEWVSVDLGTLAIHGATVPLYWTLTPVQLEYILKDANARIIFVSNTEYLDKILKIRSSLPELQTIVCFDPYPRDRDADGIMAFDELLEMGREADPEIWEDLGKTIASGKGSDLATIIYTSGTTGEPKGVMLTHSNFLSNVKAVLEVISVYDTDTCLSFLPLSHVFERVVYYLFLYVGGKIIYAESIEKLVENMQEVSPTILISVPRIYEKAYARILDRVHEASAFRKMIFGFCLRTGQEVSQKLQRGQELGFALSFKKKIADKLVFGKIRETFGGKIRLMISGGAALSKEIGEFFHAAGLLILEGYGLSETSPVISVNNPDNIRFGSVGKVLPGVKVRIEDDGEISTRGPHVMQGYYNRPEETAEVLDHDRWFATGDIGHFDPDGFLWITDRKKAIIVTAGGKNVAPQALENALSTDQFISQAFIYGDGRKFISALIVPDWERMENYAREKNIDYSSIKDLSDDPVILDFLQKRVDRAMKDFSSAEQVKKFKVMEREFSQDEGEVTPTLKLKRKEITKRYWDDLELLYE
ncbi:MAG: long-chain fatty acid--CoA ligase [bacterium]